MPPLPSVPNVLRGDIHWTIGPDIRGLTRTHWGYTGGPPSAADCIALAANFRTACTALDGLASTQCAMTSFVLTDLSSSSGKQGTNTSSIACSRSGSAPIASTCVGVEFQIARRYRGGKPKAFFPFGVTADLATTQTWGSSLLSAVNAACVTWANAFIGSVSGSTDISDQCSVSYYSGFTVVTNPTTGRSRNVPKLRTGGPVVDPILGYAARTTVSSQRKRLTR